MAAEKDAIEYEPREWRDDRDGGTPIDAAALNRMERGIADAAKGVNDINATLATYLVESDGEHATLDVNGAAIKAPCYVYDKAEGKTWFDSGVEDEPRVAPFPTRAELQEVRDSVSQKVQVAELKSSDVSYSAGRPVFRMVQNDGFVRHLIFDDNGLTYFVCNEDGSNPETIWSSV